MLAARTFLAPGRRAFVRRPAYPVYAVATGIEGAELTDDPAGADLIWVCNPNNPTGELVEPEEIAALARAHPDAAVVVDEAYYEYGGKSVVPLIAAAPNLIALRTLSKAFGLAALRVGYAVASPEVARDLDRRRDPAPVSAPSARIAAAALRNPRLDVEQTVAERERMRAALARRRIRLPAVGRELRRRPRHRPCRRARGPGARRPASPGRLPDHGPPAGRERPDPRRARRRGGAVARSLRARRQDDRRDGDPHRPHARRPGPRPRRHRHRLPRPPARPTRLPWRSRPRGRSPAATLTWTSTTRSRTSSPRSATRSAQALDGRAGVTRYGSATVPMDEARATAAVDLVRRPHAEVDLAFTGDHVGGLALTLLPHALERFAMQAGITLHVEARGEDDHHVAEAAFKALGRALREACAVGASGSTKGQL